ncbi:hypothetical protein D3C80_1903740 [compost metagenome]
MQRLVADGFGLQAFSRTQGGIPPAQHQQQPVQGNGQLLHRLFIQPCCIMPVHGMPDSGDGIPALLKPLGHYRDRRKQAQTFQYRSRLAAVKADKSQMPRLMG